MQLSFPGRRIAVGALAVGLAGLNLFAVPSASAATGDPTAVSATPAGLNLSVSWSADPDATVTGWDVTTTPASPETTAPGGARTVVLTGIRPNTPYQVAVAPIRGTVTGDAVLAADPATVAAPGGSFTALPPTRVLDTRFGTGAPTGPTTLVTLQATGQDGVPAAGVSAVALNVTVTAPRSSGYLTAYPSGQSRPIASNLNFVAGQTVANLVIVPVGADGQVVLFSSATTHLVADVAGYFSTADTASPTAGLYHPVQPTRLMDTRNGFGASTPGPGGLVKIKVVGNGTVPADNVSAVVLNTTVAGSSATTGYVTAFPTGYDRPVASTVNFVRGQIVANRTIVPVGADGQVTFYNNSGSTPLVVDVTGWFTADQDDSAGGSYFVPMTPTRLVDTRNGTGAPRSPIGPAATFTATVAGFHAIPAASAGVPAVAAVSTVTLVQPSGQTYATVFPSLTGRPLASDLNAPARRNVPNLSLSGLGPAGKLAVYNNAGSTDLVIDVSGYFVGAVHVPTTTAVAAPGQITSVGGDPASNATVTLAAAAPVRHVGDILTSGVTPATPHGLLVAVTAVSTVDGHQVLTTSPATLLEALGSGDISITAPLSGSDAMVGAQRAEARVLDESALERRQAAAAGQTPVQGATQKSPCAGDASSYVEAGFSIVPTLNFQAHLGWSWFHPTVSAKAYAQVSETAYAGFGFQAKVSCSWEKQLAHVTFPTLEFTVGPVPVVIVPELTVTLKAGLSGSFKASSSLSQQFLGQAGVQYADGKVSPIHTLSNTFTYQPLQITNAGGEASVAIEAELIGELYGLAGPTITVTATLAAKADLTKTPWWQLIFSLTARAGLHLEVSVIDIGADTGEFTLFEKVLAQAGGNPQPTAAVDLTFDDLPLGTTITTAYRPRGIDLDGDSSGDGPPILRVDNSNPTSPVLGGTTFGNPIVGRFVNPDGSARSVSAVTMDVGYIDEPGSTEVLAYDRAGQLLLTVRANSTGINTLTLSHPGIAWFVVRSTGVEDSGWATDNLRFAGFSATAAPAAAGTRATRGAASSGSTRGH